MNKKLVATIAGVGFAALAAIVGVKTVKGKNTEAVEEEISEAEEVIEEA